jgi:oligopeptide transport system substrate-binding protein
MGVTAGRTRRRLCDCVLLKVGCLFLLCCILARCGDREQSAGEKTRTAAQAPRSGGVYRTPLLNSPKGLDPARAEDNYSIAVVCQLFDGLVKFSPDLLIIPALAENWQIDQSGLVYHFFLRKNARFQNGHPITSQDVVFSLSRLIRTVPGPSILPHMLKIAGAREYRDHRADKVAGMRVINERELEILLEEPYPPFLAALGMHQARIVPESEVSERGGSFASHPVGSGAFSFVSWDKNRSIRLKRFQDYYLGPAFLDEIEYVIYPGGQIEDVLNDFTSHELEEMPVYGNIRKRLLSEKGIKWIHRPSLSLLFYGINCEDPVLKQASVRRALSMAIDREKLVSSVYDGQWEPARSILPPGIIGYNPQHLGVVSDLGEAKKEIKEAMRGPFGKDPTLEVVTSVQSPIAKAELKFVAARWALLGVRLKTKFIPDWTEFEKYVKSPSMQLYRYVWDMDIPDTDDLLHALFGSDSSVNYMRYRNTDVDRMLRSGRAIIQPEARAEIYSKIEDLIVQTAPLIPLVHLGIDMVYHSNVHGIQLNALGGHNVSLHQVWLSLGEGQ